MLKLYGWCCPKIFRTKTGSSIEALIFQSSFDSCVSIFVPFVVEGLFMVRTSCFKFCFCYTVVSFCLNVFRTDIGLKKGIFAEAIAYLVL